MDDRDRFLHLEKGRRGPVEERVTVTADRFSAEASPTGGPGAPGPSPTATAARFGDGTGLEVQEVEVQDADQPFIRCARCEADNNKFAHRCAHCGETLDDELNRGFNDKLWADRRAVQEREQLDHRELEARRTEAAVAEAAERRRLAEDMAREAGKRVRITWGADGGDDTAWGWSLLARYPASVQWAIVVASFAAPIAVLSQSESRRGAPTHWWEIAALAALGIASWLFLPKRWLMRDRYRW